MKFNFRKAKINDLDQIINITNDAKVFLKESGSQQWNDPSGYPDRSDFLKDIHNNCLYVLCNEDIIVGFEALIIGVDESYIDIDGSWLLDTSNYMTIHRIAINKDYRSQHISKYLVSNAIELAKSLDLDSVRGDTHILNVPMQKLFLSENFKHCGTITLMHTPYDNKRLAYEIIIKSL